MTVPILREGPRGCGYRKPGGVYLVGRPPISHCCILPHPLLTCPTCHHGIHPSRGWTWTVPSELLSTAKPTCWFSDVDDASAPMPPGDCCPLLALSQGAAGDTAGMIWVGEKFYPDPHAFMREALQMGISRKLARVPKGFVIGKTWVFLAHRKAIARLAIGEEPSYTQGIFLAFQPTGVEVVVTPEHAEIEEEMDALRARGFSPVIIERIGEQLDLPDEEEDAECDSAAE